ncbi:MAG TPA: hypothetical protein VJ840_10030 [Gemmatimonadaceae bacterium]|nr:hypothetical protein [Gemmatimonadaceae bacterium]
MDGFFGNKPPHVSARNTAIFGMALTVLIYFVAFFSADDTGPLWKSVRVLLPLALLFIGAFGFVAYRLRRHADNMGLAMAIAFPSAVLMMFSYGIVDSYVHGSSETKMGIVYAFLFFFASPAWTLFLWLMIPTLLRLLYKALRASLSVTRRRMRLGAVAGFGLLSAVGYTSAWRQVHAYDADAGPYFRVDQTGETIEPLYLCLWKVGSDNANAPAFPDSLNSIRAADKAMERGVKCGRTIDAIPERAYTVEYSRPKTNEFRITLLEKTRSGRPVHKLWVDQTGVLREAVVIDGKNDSVKVVNSASLVSLLLAQKRIEEYAAKNSWHGYPERLIPARETDSLPEGALEFKAYRDCTGWTSKSESCIRNWDRRRLIYTPHRNASGRVTSYSLLIPSSVPPHADPFDTDLGERFRSYLRDETGAIHAYGGNRDATRNDPAPFADELKRAQQQFARADAWRLESQKRDSIGRAQWDSVRRARQDSTRRDSVRRGWHATREVMKV